MSRRHRANKRSILPDVRYNDIVISKFMNYVMLNGKKSLAENIVYSAFDILSKKHKLEPYKVFWDALENVKPSMEVTSVRVGGANYQVPTPVSKDRSLTLALKWFVKFSLKRSERSMKERLAEELFEASQSRGGSVKKKEETHKMAESNKAFSHFSPKKG